MYDENVGKEFFNKYTDFDLAHQSRIVFGISHSSQDRKQLIYRYYRKLRNKNEELPKLVDTDLEFPWKKILPIPPFNNVVEAIWREES